LLIYPLQNIIIIIVETPFSTQNPPVFLTTTTTTLASSKHVVFLVLGGGQCALQSVSHTSIPSKAVFKLGEFPMKKTFY
jgi:hypothetical protein